MTHADLHLVPPPLEPYPLPVPISYAGMWNPVEAPDANWVALAWVEKLDGGADGTRWSRHSDSTATDGARIRSAADLDDQVRAGTVKVVKVTSVPALVREVMAWRTIAGYPLGFHEEGDECADVDPTTGVCPHVRPYAATAADARLRYDLLHILDTVDEHGPNPRVTLLDLMTTLAAAIRGELDN